MVNLLNNRCADFGCITRAGPGVLTGKTVVRIFHDTPGLTCGERLGKQHPRELLYTGSTMWWGAPDVLETGCCTSIPKLDRNNDDGGSEETASLASQAGR